MKYLHLLIIIITSFLITSCLESVLKISNLKKLEPVRAEFGVAVDRDFGTYGKVEIAYDDLTEQIKGNFTPVKRIKLADNSIVVYGISTVSEFADNRIGHIYKFTDEMLLDTSFGKNGLFDIKNEVNSVNFIAAVFENTTKLLGVDPQGRIYLGGRGQVIRLLSNGTFDYSFGKKGISVFNEKEFITIPYEIISFGLDSYTIYTERNSLNNAVKYYEFIKYNYNGEEIKFSEDHARLNLTLETNTKNKFFPIAGNQFQVLGIKDTTLSYNIIKNDGTIDLSARVTQNFPSISPALSIADVYETAEYYYLILKVESNSNVQSEIIKFSKADKVFSRVTPAKLVGSYNFSIDSSDRVGDVIYYAVKSRVSSTANERREFILKHTLGATDSFSSTVIRDYTSKFNDFMNFISAGVDSIYTLTFNNVKTDPIIVSQSYGQVTKYNSSNLEVDTLYEDGGKHDFALDYTAKINLIDASMKILLDTELNTYYLVSYWSNRLTRVSKIIKLSKDMIKTSNFNGGEILLDNSVDINYIGMEIVQDNIILFYERYNSVDQKLFVKHINKNTGVIDTLIGNSGEVEIYSIPSTANSYRKIKNSDLQLFEDEALHKGFATKLKNGAIEIYFGVGNALVFDELYVLNMSLANFSTTTIHRVLADDYVLENGEGAIGIMNFNYLDMSLSNFNSHLNARLIYANPNKFNFVNASVQSSLGNKENFILNNNTEEDELFIVPFNDYVTSTSLDGNLTSDASQSFIVDSNDDSFLVSEIKMSVYNSSSSNDDDHFSFKNNLKIYDKSFNLKYDLNDYSHLHTNIYNDQKLFLSLMVSSYYKDNTFQYTEAILEGDNPPSGMSLSEHLLIFMKMNRVQISLNQDGSVKNIKSTYLDYFDYLELHSEEYFLGRNNLDFEINGSKYRIAKTLDSSKRFTKNALYRLKKSSK